MGVGRCGLGRGGGKGYSRLSHEIGWGGDVGCRLIGSLWFVWVEARLSSRVVDFCFVLRDEKRSILHEIETTCF